MYLVKVREGDILFLCTDGVLDNLFEGDILKIIKKYQKKDKTRQNALEIAEAICREAYAKS